MGSSEKKEAASRSSSSGSGKSDNDEEPEPGARGLLDAKKAKAIKFAEEQLCNDVEEAESTAKRESQKLIDKKISTLSREVHEKVEAYRAKLEAEKKEQIDDLTKDADNNLKSLVKEAEDRAKATHAQRVRDAEAEWEKATKKLQEQTERARKKKAEKKEVTEKKAKA